MCTLYERIIALCKEKGVTGSRMCLDLGLSKSTMSDMKSGRKKGLSTTNAQKIADYLGVTVDYLLGQNLVPVFENLGDPATEMSQNKKSPPTDEIVLTEEERRVLLALREKGGIENLAKLLGIADN